MKKLIVLIFVIIIAAILVPLIFIWSLNTLFLLTIPYCFKTWIAALFIAILINGSNNKGKL
jgi:hypothetical protein